MAKPSPMIQKLIARERAASALKVEHSVSFAKALTQDAAVLAAHEMFGMSQGRVLDFVVLLCRHIVDWQALIDLDRADDPEMVASKERIDRVMRPIYGEWMPEFDVRYGIKEPPEDPLVIPEKQLAGMKRRKEAEE